MELLIPTYLYYYTKRTQVDTMACEGLFGIPLGVLQQSCYCYMSPGNREHKFNNDISRRLIVNSVHVRKQGPHTMVPRSTLQLLVLSYEITYSGYLIQDTASSLAPEESALAIRGGSGQYPSAPLRGYSNGKRRHEGRTTA